MSSKEDNNLNKQQLDFLKGQKKKDKKSGKGKGMPHKPRFWGNALSVFLIFLIIITLYSFVQEQQKEKPEEVPISVVAADIKKGEVAKITIDEEKLEVTYTDNTEKQSKKEIEAALSETLANYGVTPEQLDAVEIEVTNPRGVGFWLLNLAPFLLPILFLVIFFWFISRQVKGAGMQAFTFGQSKARVIDPNDKSQRVTFKDVAGVKEAKEELVEIVDFLKSPKKFLDIGARIPKGVLLMGPAGTGKTLLARAVAGEAKVPFFNISGSEFVEMFVGVGASVTGDTPVLVKTEKGIRLMPIADVVDAHYKEGETNIVKRVKNIETLGFKPLASGFRGERKDGKQFFGGSKWTSVGGVYRHKTDTIYKIHYRGGVIKTTGDHSVFVRDRNMITVKKSSELQEGDILINLPFKVRSTFIKGTGTTHKMRAHDFSSEHTEERYVDLYEEEYKEVVEAYNYALKNRDVLTQAYIAEAVGVSQGTVKNWQLGHYKPQFLSHNVFTAETPAKLKVTEELMRLLGYYAAEGRTAKHFTQFVFGLHEKELHEDCICLIERVFGMQPHVKEVPETNSLRITLHSSVIARFFETQCGNGSHNKCIPGMLWELPQNLFLAFLKGYTDGDGYTSGDGKLLASSVSKQLIREIAWLCGMHGIQASMREVVLPAGRVIRAGKKPLPETRAWVLKIGKTSHPFGMVAKSPHQIKKPIIQKIEKENYEGYVYDFCGCEGEAFFGGDKPVLLHNSRVRDLFKMAKKASPAIIFIDEIDAVGRVRGTGTGGGNDEREQTLNQILVEMDGFEQNEKLIIIAATNRPDVLDPALLRPGRFDRRVVLTLPDLKDREQILGIHAEHKPLAEDVDLHVIAQRTPGFSGADLYSLMNEGAILAARENRKKVSQYDLIRSIEKVLLGPERKSHLLSRKEKEITAYHEAGHALVASVLPYADPVHKVSIIARGHAGGYTLKLPLEERRLQSRNEFFDDIAVALGGYVVEKMLFGDLTTGPSSDLRVATALAHDMVTKYGMSDAFGPVALEDPLGGKTEFFGAFGGKEYSEEVSAKVDAEVNRIMNEGVERAKEAVSTHRSALDAIAGELMQKETIERDDFEKLLIANGITPKKKEEPPSAEATESEG